MMNLVNDKKFKACLIVIGNEILSGRTRDSNVQILGKKLNSMGIKLTEARTIPDIEKNIIETIRSCKGQFNYVFTTGGIGPTHDDITARAIAKAVNRKVERNREAEKIIRSYYQKEDITEARLSMADMPEGVSLIENPVSKAPGFKIENIFVLPGVPTIFEAMFDKLRHHLIGGTPILSKSITSFIPEGRLGDPLAKIQLDHPQTEIGSYPFFKNGKVGSNLVIRSEKIYELDAAAEAVSIMVRALGGVPQDF